MARLRIGGLAVAFALLSLPVAPATADSAGVLAFRDGKMFLKCPRSAGEPSGITWPGGGVNKGDKCAFSFSSKNPHKSDPRMCAALAIVDTVSKGSAKPSALAVGVGLGKVINTCELTAFGIVGPMIKQTLPPPFQGGGPWCGFAQVVSGAGVLRIGQKANPQKTVFFDRLRVRWDASGLVMTAQAFKDDVTTNNPPGQSGPIVGFMRFRNDEHKIAQGVPDTSCFTGQKNSKVDGEAAFVLLGPK